jgi:hypothetical protein
VDFLFNKELENEAECEEFLGELRTLIGGSAANT